MDLTDPRVEPVGAPQPVRKAFPALSVTARPQRALPPAAAKRPELDAKVKALLVRIYNVYIIYILGPFDKCVKF